MEKNAHKKEELLQQIDAIRASQDPPMRKIINLTRLAEDYTPEGAQQLITDLVAMLGERTVGQAANLLLMEMERLLQHDLPITLEDMRNKLDDFTRGDQRAYDGIYIYPSFAGDVYQACENPQYHDDVLICVPEVLRGKFVHVVLKVEDMERFLNTFCSDDARYRRAYSILADLEQEVMAYAPEEEFPVGFSIPYKEDGDALFEFSHFEADLSDPDARFYTLYVVYSYSTTAS